MNRFPPMLLGAILGGGFGSLAAAHPEDECPPCECSCPEVVQEAPNARQSIKDALELIEQAEAANPE